MTKHIEEAFQPTPEMLERAAKLKAPSGGFKLPKGRLSHSQVEMFLRCPRQYWFRYVKGESRPPGVALVLGTGTHKAVETTHHHIVDHGVPAPDELLLDAFSDKFDEAAEEVEPTEWTGDQDRGVIKDKGVRLVKIYNAKLAPSVKPQVKMVKTNGQDMEIRGIEKKFEVTIAGVPMLGFIDLIDTNDPSMVYSGTELKMLAKKGHEIPEEMRTVVSDFKTRARSVARDEIDGSIQLTLYSYVEGVPVVRYDQLLKTKTPRVARAHSTRGKQDYLWLKEIIHSVAKAITSGIFPPCDPTSWICSDKWCGFFHQCRGAKR
jgi:CRISPR/Cas system-associated exonuclease Cas4 (RecB family)